MAMGTGISDGYRGSDDGGYFADSDADGAGRYPDDGGYFEQPLTPINWNLLTAAQAEVEWRDLDAWVTWLKTTFGLSPAVVPPLWHRHDELVWELSALHSHFLGSFEETASPSAPIGWMRDFAEARYRLRDWVAACGTRLDRDRATRQTPWPGEQAPASAGGEVEITDRAADFEAFLRADVRARHRVEQQIREGSVS